MDVRGFIRGSIVQHEGLLSLDPKDNGNWFDAARFVNRERQVRGKGALVGSKYGVTGAALADFLGRTDVITARRIAAVTLDEAVEIGVSSYYRRPRFDRLPWGRVVAAVVDIGWGSGPATAAKMLQRSLGVADDGIIGPRTVTAYQAAIQEMGEERLMARLTDQREAYYRDIASNEGPNDPDRRFLGGWLNRAQSFLAKTAWWRKW